MCLNGGININNLINVCGKDRVFENEPLKNHTSFRIGGNAKAVIIPETIEELLSVIKQLRNEKFVIIGNGSNILAPDEGVDYYVIKTTKINKVSVRDNEILAECGATLSKIANQAMENSLKGMEFASGIPGTIGGGVVMNAGAYDGELSQIVVKTTYCNRDGDVFELTNEEHEFAYRHSFFSNKDYIILSSIVRLNYGDKSEILAKMRELNQRRADKQPLNFPSAGSTFKRPEGYFAARLIDDSGLRGMRVGGAQVSEKHCGFIINADNASSEDVKKLMALCQDKVYEKFGVKIEPEIKIL